VVGRGTSNPYDDIEDLTFGEVNEYAF